MSFKWCKHRDNRGEDGCAEYAKNRAEMAR